MFDDMLRLGHVMAYDCKNNKTGETWVEYGLALEGEDEPFETFSTLEEARARARQIENDMYTAVACIEAAHNGPTVLA